MRNILVTSALPYANGNLHLGHMFGYVQTDIWVRYQRMKGNKCYFVCGSDTHGTPIMFNAKKKKVSPDSLVQSFINNHKLDFKKFNISFDNYYSTNGALNKKFANYIYDKLDGRGFIKMCPVEQLYDNYEKTFLPDRFVKGTCPKCYADDQYGDTCEVCSSSYDSIELINPISSFSNKTPVRKTSDHFFFKLSCFSNSLENWLNNNDNLQPEIVNKAKEWISSGLKDWDISRDEPYFGIPIPGTKRKYFYVWFDAPIGYMSSFKDFCKSSGVSFNDYWINGGNTEIYHFIGKDISYFHTLFWPAILEASGFQKPKSIFVNGFLTINDKKISKSKGNLYPIRNINRDINIESFRYYFATKMSNKVSDVDFNVLDFRQRVNSDMIGKIVNIASRCSPFVEKFYDNVVSDSISGFSIINSLGSYHKLISDFYEERNFSKALNLLIKMADDTNKLISLNKPWDLIKNKENHLKVHQICSLGINLFKVIVGYLKPVIPKFVRDVEDYLNYSYSSWEEIPTILLSHRVNSFNHLFKRIREKDMREIFSNTSFNKK